MDNARPDAGRQFFPCAFWSSIERGYRPLRTHSLRTARCRCKRTARAISAAARGLRYIKEIGAQALESGVALTETRRVFVGKLAEITSALRQKEHRAVRKPLAHPRPHSICDDALQRRLAHALMDAADTLPPLLLPILLPILPTVLLQILPPMLRPMLPPMFSIDERGGRAQTRAATRRFHTGHPANHFVGERAIEVAMRRRIAAEPSMRSHAGLAAERVDHQAAVIRDRRQIGAGEIEACLEQRVLDKGGAGFFRRAIVKAGLAQRQRREAEAAQQQPVLVELGGIGGGDQQRFHRAGELIFGLAGVIAL